jgi:putative ABC transport system permease protein
MFAPIQTCHVFEGAVRPADVERQVSPRRRRRASSWVAAGRRHSARRPLRLLRGRAIDERDAAAREAVAVINATLARTFFAAEEPIGKRIKMGAPAAPRPWLTIVGVVGDVRYRGLEAEPGPQIYVPFRQEPAPALTLVARTAGEPGGAKAALAAAVQAVDRELPVTQLRTMDEVAADSLADRRFQVILTSGFAWISLLLAATGIYGVISYRVARRTQEIGVRMALGADRQRVLRLVLREVVVLAGAGAVLGAGGGLLGARFLQGFLYGITPTDAVTFVAAPAVLLAVALLAGWIPARRATRIDPIVALRYE